MHRRDHEPEYGPNPYHDQPLPAEAPHIGRLTQAAIALFFALAAIYLGA